MTMNSYRQQVYSPQSKQPDKNVFIERPEKDGSNNTILLKQKKEEKVRCGLALCTFEKEDQWYIDSGCAHHMCENNRKFISLNENKSAKVIIGNSTHLKVL